MDGNLYVDINYMRVFSIILNAFLWIIIIYFITKFIKSKKDKK